MIKRGPRAETPLSTSVGLTLVTVGLVAIEVYLSCAVLCLSAIGTTAGGVTFLIGAPLPTVIATVIVVCVWRRRRSAAD